MKLEALLRNIGSDSEVGRQVYALWKPKNGPAKRSIAAKVGPLRRGQTTWWENHNGALLALAKLLNISPECLLQQAAATESLGFHELPELRAMKAGDPPFLLDSRAVRRGDSDWCVRDAPYDFRPSSRHAVMNAPGKHLHRGSHTRLRNR